MSDYNRYEAPRSRVDGRVIQQFGEVKIFGVSGRIGRVRYIAYNFGVTSLISFALGMMGFFSALIQPAKGATPGIIMGTLMIIIYVVIVVYTVTVTIRRCRDFNGSGWLSLLLLVPLANFIFFLALMLVPGTDGENNYGLPPPPNTKGAIVAASILPVVAIMGVLAAIAIPAYQDYVKRAQMIQQQHEQQR